MIDWPRVHELRDEVGADEFDEVVDLFLEEVGSVIDRLRLSADPAALEGDLHFLKGSAQSLGFSAFSDLCQQGETQSAAGNARQVDMAAIIESFDLSKNVFFSQLPDQLGK